MKIRCRFCRTESIFEDCDTYLFSTFDASREFDVKNFLSVCVCGAGLHLTVVKKLGGVAEMQIFWRQNEISYREQELQELEKQLAADRRDLEEIRGARL